MKSGSNNKSEQEVKKIVLDRENITFEDPLAEKKRAEIEKRTDVEAERIKRLLKLPDLTRKENSPVKFIVDRIISLPQFKDFDIVKIPEILSVENEFDILNTPKDHPSRRKTDTYYLDENTVLRTQTTAMWSYYLKDQRIIGKLVNRGNIGALCYGKVYRKDTVDKNHYPVFHQIDGLYICKKEKKIITSQDLVSVLVDIAKGIYGEDVEWRIVPDTFPYTESSIQMDIKWRGKWFEVLGAGLVKRDIYPNFHLDPNVYNGWAFGFGLDRLAMIKMGIPDIRILWSNDERIIRQFKDINSQYKEVSKYPSTYRDISFVVDKNFDYNSYCDLIRECAKDLVEEVKLIDEYENREKFGEDKKSFTFRIIYRSFERTLTNEEVNEIQEKIRQKTAKELNATLR